MESGPPAMRSRRHFTPRMNMELARDAADMIREVKAGRTQIIDGRSKPRFEGHEVEPRPVPRLGHMPGARNIPYNTLIGENGVMRPEAELRAIFENAGINPGKPVIATCGSGVTACVIVLALAILGNEYAAVYDGSWAEWSAVPSAPITTGP